MNIIFTCMKNILGFLQFAWIKVIEKLNFIEYLIKMQLACFHGKYPVVHFIIPCNACDLLFPVFIYNLPVL